MPPEKMPAGDVPFGPAAAAVRVRNWLPSTTDPLPDSVVIEAPEVVPEMSNVPFVATDTPLDVAMLPLPVSAKVAVPVVGAIVVRPV
jgi:hypothetical protein